MIYFLEEISDTLSCKDSRVFPLFQAAKFVIVIIQIAVPFALVIWGSLDWFKALIAGDEKEMRLRRRPFISRLIAAIVILILPWLVQLIASQIVGSDTQNYWRCFIEAKPKLDFSSWSVNPSTSSGSSNTTPTHAECSQYHDGKEQCESHGCHWRNVPGSTTQYACFKN